MLNKECSHPTCGNKCRRIKKSKKIYNLKRIPIRRASKNQRSILGGRRKLSERDRVLFSEIWEERDHIDFETGDPIYSEPLTIFFHHVLKRRKYEKFRWCKWNIILLQWDKHTNADNYDRVMPKVKAYKDYLIKHLDQINTGKFIPSFENFNKQYKNLH